MKTKLIYIALLFFVIVSSSCKKNDLAPKNDLVFNNQTDVLQIKFAKILASALADNYELRNVIKTEASKQFDKDYDVLYQLIKDKNIGSQTISELLSNYASSKEDFASLENKLPLLTILIPTLPNFAPESWNPTTEIPQVAVALSDKGDVPMYDKSGKETIVPSGYVPGIPVVVVKQNERVIVNNNGQLKSEKISQAFSNSARSISYSFADKAFNGLSTTNNNNLLKRDVAPNEIDIRNIEAYNMGIEWHRDYVYYGLTSNTDHGPLKNNYSEFITEFKFSNGVDASAAYSKIADQTGDPRINATKVSGGQDWTEGNFEFRITVVMNSKNGIGSELTKIFTAKGSDLFVVRYEKVSFFLYRVKSIKPMPFNPNIELVPWDLENYGTGWKFIVYEYDDSQEITQTVENTSTYATNFEFNLGVKDKWGLKFGASASSTSKNTYSIKTTLTSDYLGDASLTFDQPIIIGPGDVSGTYKTRAISTGIVDLSVEPKRVY